jgi:hypothetical protein
MFKIDDEDKLSINSYAQKRKERIFLHKNNVLEWLFSRVFGNFTVTFVNGPLFRAKIRPKTKICSRFFFAILELCCKHFFS